MTRRPRLALSAAPCRPVQVYENDLHAVDPFGERLDGASDAIAAEGFEAFEGVTLR